MDGGVEVEDCENVPSETRPSYAWVDGPEGRVLMNGDKTKTLTTRVKKLFRQRWNRMIAYIESTCRDLLVLSEPDEEGSCGAFLMVIGPEGEVHTYGTPELIGDPIVQQLLASNENVLHTYHVRSKEVKRLERLATSQKDAVQVENAAGARQAEAQGVSNQRRERIASSNDADV